MKRFLLLLTLTAFLLGGCQSSSMTDPSTPSDDATESSEALIDVIDTTPKTPSYITFTITPSWEVHFDEDGLILELVPLNEDAQDLLKDMNLTGTNLNDGLPLLLDQAKNKGYLESGDTIQFELHFQEATSQQMMVQTIQTYEVIQEYLDTSTLENIDVNGIWVDNNPAEQAPATEGGSPEETIPEYNSPSGNDIPQDTPPSLNNDLDYPVLLASETDANGSITYEKILIDDGYIQEFFFVQDRLKTDILYIDGCARTTQYENDIPIESFTLCPDGAYYTQEYYPDFVVKSINRHDIDGRISTTHFYPSGIMETSRIDYPDGTYEMTTFAPNGLPLSTIGSFGTSSLTYHENGNVASIENYGVDGSISKNTYDSEGRETYQYWRRASGESAEYIYNDNFDYTITVYKSNGQIDYIHHVNAGGMLIGGVDRYGRSFTVDRHGNTIYEE